MLKDRDAAREFFKPLTFKDVTEENFYRLAHILSKILTNWNIDLQGNIITNKYQMKLESHKDYPNIKPLTYNAKTKEAFIIVNCDNYSMREGITFRKDGWIGFAGWADNDNVRPFLDAFEEWVNLLKFEKQVSQLKPYESYTYIGDYEILPKKANLYDVATMADKTFIYLDDWVYQPNAEETALQKVREIINDSEDCELKRNLIAFLDGNNISYIETPLGKMNKTMFKKLYRKYENIAKFLNDNSDDYMRTHDKQCRKLYDIYIQKIENIEDEPFEDLTEQELEEFNYTSEYERETIRRMAMVKLARIWENGN